MDTKCEACVAAIIAFSHNCLHKRESLTVWEYGSERLIRDVGRGSSGVAAAEGRVMSGLQCGAVVDGRRAERIGRQGVLHHGCLRRQHRRCYRWCIVRLLQHVCCAQCLLNTRMHEYLRDMVH